jgi:carbamoyltransferase
VNLRVKRREPWRPFAPSVLESAYHEIFEARIDSPFMILACQVHENWRSRLPAIVHVDGSARPQTVSTETNELYYRLIREFERRSGLAVVLNTSFNLEDEPIVNAPDQALATFFRSGLEILVIGNFAITKT